MSQRTPLKGKQGVDHERIKSSMRIKLRQNIQIRRQRSLETYLLCKLLNWQKAQALTMLVKHHFSSILQGAFSFALIKRNVSCFKPVSANAALMI